MTEHVRYIVETPNGFLGSRAFKYGPGRGTYASDHAALGTARIYTRKGDALRACTENDKVREVRIQLVEDE